MNYRSCKKLPDAELLNKLFSYDPDTGKVKRIFRIGGRSKVGDIVGTRDSKGHLQVYIMNGLYMLHRIIWKLYYQEEPLGEIDHINGDKTDNRINNLRVVKAGENNKNTKIPKNNTSGHTGVTWNTSSKKWQAQIVSNRKRYYLGVFDNFEDAVKERKKAEKKYGFHENHGRP